MFKVRIVYTFLFLFLWVIGFSQVKRQDPDVIRSAYVLLFADQIEWGKLPTSKFRIVCVGLSPNRVEILSKMSQTKRAGGLPIKIISVNKLSEILEAEMIVLSEERTRDYNTIYKRVLNKKTIVVTEDLLFKKHMMINLHLKGNNTVAFEIDKENIEQQQLGVKLELILFGGGSDGDVLNEYKKVQVELWSALDSLEKEKKILIASRKEIVALQKGIIIEKKKLEQQKLISEKQSSIITSQEYEISEKEKEIDKFSSHLDAVKEDIDAREFQLKIKNGELKRFELDVSNKQQELKGVNKEVRGQLEKIKNQKEQIKIQEQIIKNDVDVIERQKFLLALQIGIIVLVAVVLLLLFLTFRRNKKNNRKLASQNREIQKQTVELNARNQQLVISKEEIQIAFKELHDAQSQLVQAEKLASLGMLVAGVAHDINTPLGAIKASAENMPVVMRKLFLGFIDLVRSFSERELIVFRVLVDHWGQEVVMYSTVEKRKIRRRLKIELEDQGIPNASVLSVLLVEVGVYEVEPVYMLLIDREDNVNVFENLKVVIDLRSIGGTIKQAVDKASDVVNALKKYSREDDEAMEEVDVKDSLETVISIYGRNLTDVNLELKFEDYQGEVLGKYSALCQVWTNLIHNSVQAMGGKGALEIGITPDNERLLIYVKDSGGGIKEEDKDKIFNTFFTTKKRGEGTGLGLDICRKIIEKHQGEITFTSQFGIGTTFNVYLPIVKY